MRTKEEIKKWFKSKNWYSRFCYLFKQKHNIEFLDYLNKLDSQDYQSIILKAFPFDCTEEGVRYWSKVSINYSNWFFNIKK